jgi:uncharacterized membrane protein
VTSTRILVGGFHPAGLPLLGLKALSLTSRHLLTLFDSIYLAALAVWIGSAVFIVFGLNPILLKAIGSESASRLIRAIYPRYYVGGAIAGAVALPAFVAGPLCYSEYRGAMVAVQTRSHRRSAR